MPVRRLGGQHLTCERAYEFPSDQFFLPDFLSKIIELSNFVYVLQYKLDIHV